MLTLSRYLAIMLCAMALAVGLTHALAVTPDTSLGNITMVLQLLATALAVVLTIALRGRPGFGMAVGATVLLALATLMWAGATLPGFLDRENLNRFFSWTGLGAATTTVLPAGNIDLAALSIWLVGMSFLVLSSVRQPAMRPRGPLPLMRETLTRM